MPRPTSSSHTHCHHCGARYEDASSWPRICGACDAMTWRNPLPVAVLCVPVIDVGRRGLLLIDRDLSPQGIALPGGFVEHGEDWRQAAVRELDEETGLPASADEVQIIDTLSTPDGATLLTFGLLTRAVALEHLAAKFVAQPGEVRGYQVAFSTSDEVVAQIIFPTHRQIAERVLAAGR